MEWRFNAPREAPVAFFQLQNGVDTNSLLMLALLNSKHGAENAPSADTEYCTHGNSSLQCG